MEICVIRHKDGGQVCGYVLFIRLLCVILQKNWRTGLRMMNADVVAGRKRRILKVGKKYLSCAPLKVKKRKEALILYARAVIETSLIRSGFKTPSKVQWPRCPASAGFASDFLN